jgi:hypothetical protein
VQLIVACSRGVGGRIEQSGLKARLTDLGVEWVNDTCILSMPMLRSRARVLLTDSGKYAFYAPGLLRTETLLASLPDCVEAAVSGRLLRSGAIWGR